MSRSTLDDLAGLLRTCLEEGRNVEIDGLGRFLPRGDDFEFHPDRRQRVFLAYAVEDCVQVERLFDALTELGFDPWMDRRKLLPGQNWPRAIDRAIQMSDFFVPCFSRLSAGKRGRFHAELRYALNCALERPMDGVYVIPARLEECSLPTRITESIQYVDLFPDFQNGLQRMVASMRLRKPQLL